MAERDHILADFQACTGIEDIGESIAILEQHDWNLMPAVQAAMPGLDSPEMVVPPPIPPSAMEGPPPFSQISPGFPNPPSMFPGSGIPFYDLTQSESSPLPMALGGLTGIGFGNSSAAAASASSVASTSDSSAQPSTSSGSRSTRMIHFSIEYRNKNIPLVLSETETVARIKELLEAETGLPKSKQQLGGWVNKNDRRIEDSDVLKELRLPRDNTLFLLAPDTTGEFKTNNGENFFEALSQTFTLNIRYKDKEKMYKLNFPGSKTVQEVKQDVFNLIDVPVRHQEWTGWPDAAQDETMTLAGVGISYPCHSLEVRRSRPPEHNKPPTAKEEEKMEVEEESDPETIELSDDDFEDAHESFNIDDDMFGADEPSRRAGPLMPENAADQTAALEHFASEFANRYGECPPVFYIGALEDAIKDALQTRARERKLLAIYLHHDASILANVFCSRILCAESVVNFLSNNFVTWAWDLTSEANRARLLTMCTQHFGSVAANTVRNFRPDELPLLLLISRNRSVNEVVNVIHANTTLDEFMTHLIQAIDVFQEGIRQEIVEEDERDQRETMKREQDLAYEQSLAADRAKADARRQEEEEIRKKDLEEEIKRNEEETKKREEEMEKEAIRQSVADQLPEEPAENCSEPVSMIRFRLPGGGILVRRFLAQNPLQVLLNFVTSKGYHVSEHKVLTTFPRRDLTMLDPTQSLQALKLFPQETVILEEI